MDSSYKIEKKVSDFVTANRLIENGDTVVIGVSGGADSTCLLFLLPELSKRIDFEIKVLHVEHGIRGESSLQDAAFVEGLCGENHVPCKLVQIDAVGYAKAHSLTLEEAARILRYRVFEEYRKELLGASNADSKPCKSVKIAVAHHINDQAETVIFQMLRGSGIKGMGGMNPKRDHIIRPLLCLSRAEILDYLNEKGISYRTDESNNDNSYSRNFLRNELIPKMESLQPQAVMHISEMAAELREVDAYMCRQAGPIYDSCVLRDKDVLRLNVAGMSQVDPVIIRTVIRMAVSECVPNRKDVGRSHIEAIMELIDKGSGKKVNLPKGVLVERQGDNLLFLRTDFCECKCSEKVINPIRIELFRDDARATGRKLTEYDFAEGKIASVRIFDREDDYEVSRSNYTKCFDYDMITDGLEIRTAEPGDYLVIDGAGHRKDVKDYFVNEKIPAYLRDEVLLFTDGSHVMWVPGYRISEYYKVTDKTKTIIEISVTGGFPWEKK